MTISRQRSHQKRLRLKGRCTSCGRPAAPSKRKNALNGKSNLCEEHQLARREYDRTRKGSRRRNLGAFSYKLEENKTLAKAAGK